MAACGDDGGTEGEDDSRDGDSGSSTTSGDAGTRTNAKTDASGISNGDGGNTTAESPSSGGKCGNGEYKSNESELSLCGASESDDSCPPISVLNGYTKFVGDLNLYPVNDSDLAGASCLESAGSLVVAQSAELSTLKSLSNVKSVTGLEIVGNEKLNSLAGLDSLHQALTLTISVNDVMEELSGLPTGLKIGSLYVTSNPELTSIDGLIASKIEIADSLAFENNPKLSSCAVAEFAKKFPNAELSNFGNMVDQCD